jgi:amidohydrolase
MLRFDMDALAVQEENLFPYASKTPGIMHACGHDGHVTIGLGSATLFQRHRDTWPGTIKLVFQPAEEGAGGAKLMLREGVLNDFGPRPDLSLGLHLWNQLPFGEVGVTAGPVMAAADRWALTVKGRGGHGALPHETIDPVVAAAQLVSALQTVVSRNVSPLKTAVLSVGTINGGTAFNVIPEQVDLTGTIRTFEAEVRDQVVQRMEALGQGIATAMGVELDLDVGLLVPAVVNDATATALVQESAEAVLGPEHVRTDYRTMVSEDMSFFMQEIPGCFMYVGASDAKHGLEFGHHHPRFNFEEAALPLGVAILTDAAIRYLSSNA